MIVEAPWPPGSTEGDSVGEAARSREAVAVHVSERSCSGYCSKHADPLALSSETGAPTCE